MCSVRAVASPCPLLSYPSSFLSSSLPFPFLQSPPYRSPPRFPSEDYALSEANIRFTRERNTSGARARAFFPLSGVFASRARVRERMHVSAFTREQAGSPRAVIEDFGP